MSELRFKKQTRLLATAAISAFCMTLSVNATETASFNCAVAETFNEKIVCTTPHLAKLDKRMASAYAIARAGTTNADKLSASQSAWALRLRDSCETETCLTEVYTDRINALQRLAATPHDSKHTHDDDGRQCDRNKGHKKAHHQDHQQHGGDSDATATPVGY